MTENNVDLIMNKVFKREYARLNTFQDFFKKRQISESEAISNTSELIDAYSLLLQEAVKLTKIGDLNQKKLFGANKELEEQKRLLYLASIIDPMLNIYNRTYLIQVLIAEFAKSKRYHHLFSCILIDIDDFKKINDNYGHQIGDQVLIRIANVIKKQLREVDSFGRYGGEEFIIVLPNTNAHEALKAAEKVRLKIAKTDFNDLSQGLSLTISQGLSDSSIDNLQSEDDLLYQVDTALYQAKNSGKNCSVMYKKTSETVFKP